MRKTLTIEKASFTENSVDCLYVFDSSKKSEYLLIKYKDPNKLFKTRLKYKQSHIKSLVILSEKKAKGFFSSKRNQKVCLIELNDNNKIVIRVKQKLYKKLESGIFEKIILDKKITHNFEQGKLEQETSNDITKKLEQIYKMWKEGILTKYEFKIAKKKVLNY